MDLPQITIEGSPRAMGLGHGEQLREPIQRFVEHRIQATHAYLDERSHSADFDLRDVARQCLEIVRDWDPDGYEEHIGVADGADVNAADLYAAGNYSDMRDLVLLDHPEFRQLPAWDEGCTSFALPGALTANSQVLVGQTWDLHPDDMQFVTAIHRLPAEGPETWSVTCAGCPTLIGMNEHGLYVGTTNIKIHGVRPGVAYLSLLHRAIRCATREIAAEIIANAPRVAAHTYWLADERGAIELECASTRVVKRELSDDTPLWQTNHCLDESHQQHEAEAPSESSRCRFDRAGEILARGGHDIDSIRAMFSDRSDGINSINRYPDDRQYAATNACMIGVPAERMFMACRGPADRGIWKHLAFERIGTPTG